MLMGQFKTLRQKAFFVLFSFVVVNVIILGITLFSISKQKDDGKIINLAGRQRMLVQKMTRQAFGIQLGYNTPAELEATMTVFDRVLNGFLNGDDIQGIPKVSDSEILTQLRRAQQQWNRFATQLQVIMTATRPEEKQQALAYIAENNEPLLEAVHGVVQLFEEKLHGKVMRLVWFQVAFLVFTAGIVVMGKRLITETISRPLEELRQLTQDVAEGNFDVEMPVRSDDEIGQLAENFNQMVARLRRFTKELQDEKKQMEMMTREVKERNAELRKSVEYILEGLERFAEGDLTVELNRSEDCNAEMGRLCDGFNTAVRKIKKLIENIQDGAGIVDDTTVEIRQATDVLSEGIAQYTAQFEESAAAMEEMSRTLVQSSENLKDANRYAAESQKIAGKGQEIVEATIERMRGITAMVNETTQLVEKLGASSLEIGEIIQVINEIADQTNLLALNAAIEAARAGEQGKGFAVVADEVRKLAERTTKATDQIAEMIRAIQTETQNVVEFMKRGEKAVDEGLELAKDAGTALEEIVDSVKTVVEKMNTIAAAGEEQASAVEEMSRNIDAISEVTREAARNVNGIAETLEKLNGFTQDLRRMLRQFKYSEFEVAPATPSSVMESF